MKQYSYLLIGGDKRQLCLLDIFKTKGKKADCIFLDNENYSETALDKIDNADVIIMPIPSSQDGIHLYAPFCEDKIVLTKITERLDENKILFIGGENSAFLESKPIRKVNLLEYEPMTLKNAMATAEAALSILINNTETTLFGANILIIGYGRIGKFLSEYLTALHSNVTVCARRNTSKTSAFLEGNNIIGFNELENTLPKSNIVINTVPSLVLEERLLKRINNNTLIIDLASKPGGVDFAAAENFGIKTIHALSLPGKYSPISAATYIEQAINDTLT